MLKKKNVTVMLTLSLAISLIDNNHTQQLRKEGKYWVGEIQKLFDVKRGGTLLINDIRGDVTIRPWGKTKCKFMK